jgi:hypothetical protein
MSLILGILAQDVAGAGGGTSYESIATANLGGTQATITFDNISSSYTHLQLRGIARVGGGSSGGSENIYLRFNSDTGSNYSFHYMYGDGSSSASGSGANQSLILAGKPAAGGDISNNFGAFVTDILDYTNSNKHTTVRTLTGIDNNSNGVLFFSSGVWRNTNAVTRIDLTAGTDYVQYTHIALYGIKGV